MMRSILRNRWLVPTVLVLAATRPALAQGRPGDGRTPEFPPPSIVDYHPRSTLVVPVHLVPRARYPAVDIHGHPPTLRSPDIVNRVGAAMDALNLQVMVNATPSSGDRLAQQLAAVKASQYPDRFVMFASLDLRKVGPGSGARIAAQLEADVKAGAVGIGEIMKSFGLSIQKADGARAEPGAPGGDVRQESQPVQ